jgi:Trk-type K+ transport system membrane component
MNDLKTNEKGSSEESKNKIGDLIPEELLEAVPEKDRERFITIFQRTAFSSIEKKNNHLTEKITSDHITSIITNSDTQDKRDRDERKGQRRLNLIIFMLSLAFLTFIIVFLKDDKELLYKIIIAVISFLGGVGIGKSGMLKI